jgi:DNA-binding transcriptional ArsR family regulator
MDQCAAQRQQLSEEFQSCRRIFLALGDETRQQIFLALLEHEKIGMRVPEITARTHLSRPAVSHHLQILKDAGLIRMHRAGTRNYYYVAASESCWNGLKALVDHVDRVVKSAAENEYPRLREDEGP